jgi:hypothetical protein
MPRRREVPKREILPDPKFSSTELTKFVNVIMLDGKKAVAERIVYGALDQIAKKGGKDPIEVFTLAINNVKPMVEVKSRRVGWRLPCAGCARLQRNGARSRCRSVWPVSLRRRRRDAAVR